MNGLNKMLSRKYGKWRKGIDFGTACKIILFVVTTILLVIAISSILNRGIIDAPIPNPFSSYTDVA